MKIVPRSANLIPEPMNNSFMQVCIN